MNIRTYLFVLLGCLGCAETAPAMTMHNFAKMNMDDQATYVTLLVEGAVTMLKTKDQGEQAQKAIILFNNSGKSGGLSQFVVNLKMMEGLNNRNAINPNNRAPVYEVEDAMELTLKDNGISVPVGYLQTINKDFVPSSHKFYPQDVSH